MKFINIIFLIMILQGCSNSGELKSVDGITPIVETANENLKSPTNDVEVISDINLWVHPSKNYINSIGILEKVEIRNKKITFYITTKDGNFSYEILTNIAKYNEFEDYTVISTDSEAKTRSIDITCSKSDKRVIRINVKFSN